MDALQALQTKRDTRTYSGQPVDEATLAAVLDAARMAGSAKNAQPVRLVVVTEQTAKEGLTGAGDFAAWIDQAPVVIVATVRADAGPRQLYDVGRHTQNLMVAAHALGLATCPVTIHHHDVARDLLGIPDDIVPAMIVTQGWPPAGDAEPSPIAGPRVPLGDYAKNEKW